MTKIIRFHELGDPKVLRYEDDDARVPGAGEVAVNVRAIGLNRAEAAFRRGRYLEAPKLPASLGYEASGIIDAVGPGVEGFAAGDEVSVIPAFSMNAYSVYAQRAIVPAHSLVPKPVQLSWTQAASVWMQYLTAWGALVSFCGVGKGDFVLITAASSSVGLAAIQIVNAQGGTPIAITRTSEKRDALERAGAAHVIASSEEDLVAQVARITGDRGARVAFDPVAGPGIETLAQALSLHGILVIYGRLSSEPTPFPMGPAMSKQLTLRGYTLFEIVADPERLAQAKRYILDGLESGRLTPTIAKTFAFEDMVAAHTYLESNQQVGKVVVTVD